MLRILSVGCDRVTHGSAPPHLPIHAYLVTGQLSSLCYQKNPHMSRSWNHMTSHYLKMGMLDPWLGTRDHKICLLITFVSHQRLGGLSKYSFCSILEKTDHVIKLMHIIILIWTELGASINTGRYFISVDLVSPKLNPLQMTWGSVLRYDVKIWNPQLEVIVLSYLLIKWTVLLPRYEHHRLI